MVAPLLLTIPYSPTDDPPALTTVFLIVLLVAPFVALALPTHITAVLLLVLVFCIVKFLDTPPTVLEPSIIIKSAPSNFIIELEEDPVIVAVTPDAGLIVTVLVALAPVIELIVIGKVSVPLLYVDKRLRVTGAEIPQVARSDNAFVKLE